MIESEVNNLSSSVVSSEITDRGEMEIVHSAPLIFGFLITLILVTFFHNVVRVCVDIFSIYLQVVCIVMSVAISRGVEVKYEHKNTERTHENYAFLPGPFSSLNMYKLV